MSDLTDLENKYYMQVARRQPVVIVRGEGTRVWDENEKEYLDFTSGWAVNTLGHCHPVLVRAVEEQARTLMQTSNQFFTVPQVKLAQILVENSCLDRVFFSNSGAEANEGVVKLARKYGKINRDGAYEVITALNSFHGRTLTMAAATGQPAYQEQWQPLAPGFTNVPYDDIDAIKEATNSKTCAVMLEPVQGEGGVNVPANDYLKQIRAWCDEQNLVMILDEVQTGIGRLGTLFGYQRFGVEPDAITLAKGLGGGVPIGAFMAKEKFCLLAPGDHGSTYGGNALTCAGAFAVVDHVVQNNVPPHASAMGQRLREGLNALASRYENINEVRGMGLLLAVQFSSDISGQLVSLCNEEGLLLNPVRPNAIRFMPPLNVSPQEIDTALERLGKALSKVVSG
ncbi:MAG: aspartate aminotransferase family protein [Dehalococcoidia bacterium]|jgi:acetylornithine/N-succinyldiaminopimelate aminotransferase|nr:aspartate aminotransferase family protein [Dehalococcoidia bacterium]